MDLKNEQAFLEYVTAAIENDKVVLPTLPEVALSVRQAVNSGNASDAEISRIIANDPGLAARLLQIVNSPLFRARTKVETLQNAVTRMGHNTIRTVVISLAMQQIFKPKLLVLDEHFHAIWKHSVNISAVSRALALRCGHLNKEEAMLAGLIHQIGKLPILTLAEKFPELAQDREALDNLLTKLHPHIGKLIMSKWDMPDAISKVPWEYVDFSRDSGPKADYVDVVQVAYIESEMVHNPTLASVVQDVPAFRKLGLDPAVEVLEIEGVAEEIEEAKQIFL
jgi:HD-like signal output (HDOD) protein